MDRFVRAIPREKREEDVAREQQRSNQAIQEAREEASVWKRKREEDHAEAKRQRKLEGKGPGRPAADRGPVKQHTAPAVQPQQHDSSTATRKEKSRSKMGHSRKGSTRVRPGLIAVCAMLTEKFCKLAAGVCAMPLKNSACPQLMRNLRCAMANLSHWQGCAIPAQCTQTIHEKSGCAMVTRLYGITVCPQSVRDTKF